MAELHELSFMAASFAHQCLLNLVLFLFSDCEYFKERTPTIMNTKELMFDTNSTTFLDPVVIDLGYSEFEVSNLIKSTMIYVFNITNHSILSWFYQTSAWSCVPFHFECAVNDIYTHILNGSYSLVS